MKKIIVLIIVLAITIFSFAEKITVEQWKEDIEFLKYIFLETHPLLKENNLKMKFSNYIDNLEKNLNNLSDTEIYLSLREGISLINDNHSYFTCSDKVMIYERFFPFVFKDLGDDYFLLMTTEEYKPLIGSKLLKVNGYNIKEIENKLSSLTPKENWQSVKLFTNEHLNNYEVLMFKKIIDKKKCSYTFEKDGKIIEVTTGLYGSKEDENISEYQGKIPLPYESNGTHFLWKYIPEKKAVYFNIKSMKEPEQFYDITSQIFDFMSKNDVDKMIIDVRNNGGGATFWDGFIDLLYLKDNINKKGHLFVITGKRTFSSAMMFTYKAKEELNSIIIGEIPLQKPNFYYGRSYELPNTQLSFKCSSIFVHLDEKDTDHLTPDVLVSEKAEDFFNGEDTILKYIFNNY